MTRETGLEARRKLLLCSCEDTMRLDAAAIAGACKTKARTARQACRGDLAVFRGLAQEGELTVACTQEAPRFREVAEEERLAAAITFVNVRETAGWSRHGGELTPKFAALLAAGEVVEPKPVAVTLQSEGVTLIVGRDQVALDIASRLKDRLDLTVLLLPGADVVPPRLSEWPVRQGRVRSVTGHLGAFEVKIDAFAEATPSSRSRLEFGLGRDGLVSRCDLLIDVAGGPPLVTAPELRDGYLRADPADRLAVAELIARAGDLVGTFDKPRYVTFKADLCAHSRSRKVGCTRCLDLCPAGAIAPAGNHVAIDAALCGGCGMCAAACPTGAASYALPPVATLVARLKALLSTYRSAGGGRPVVLVHDEDHGAGLIDALARHGDGLPANVLPLAVNEVTQVGLEAIAAALAYGAARVLALVRARPRHDIAGLRSTIATADAIASALGYGRDAVALVETDDPDALAERLAAPAVATGSPRPASFLPPAAKRDLLTLALRELHRAAPAPVDVVPLPKGAPLGRIMVDTKGCTLCLSCVSACPTRALGDAADRPLLSFDESLCVQCGLCQSTCPERVITLEPRVSFAAYEAGPVVVKQEEPFCCTGCGKPFGTKSAIERVISKLKERHWMFAGESADRLQLLTLCDTCRIEKVTNAGIDPYAGPPRPPVRTSEDYLKEREAAAAREADMLKRIDKGEV